MSSVKNKKKSEKLTKIHPALDFTDDLAIVSIPLECGGEEKSGQYLAITSNREKFILNADELKKRNLYSTTKFFLTDSRWSIENVDHWISGECKAPSLKEVFNKIRNEFECYLDYEDARLYSFMSIWAIGTYFHQLFDAYPILHLTGMSGSGKSKSMDLMEQFTFNAKNSSNISDSALFRFVEGTRCTLLLDENEKIANDKELSSQINHLLSGYKKGAKVVRSEKDKNEAYRPATFEIYSPKAIANIKGIRHGALLNRCIQFIMTPSTSKKSNLHLNWSDPKWGDIRNDLYMCLMGSWKKVKEAVNKINAMEFDLTGYSYTSWLPILTLAYLIDLKVFHEMFGLAKGKIKDQEEEAEDRPHRILLLTIFNMCKADGNKVFVKKKYDGHYFLKTRQVYRVLINELGYQESDKPYWMNPRSVGRMIGSLSIGKKKLERVDGRPVRGYWIELERLKKVMKRTGISVSNKKQKGY